ncbi:hypothetical protein [Fimbriiglobus ruber]|uniref:ABC-2 type transport system permease protein n=1 Tax=Fimbriiglobus ruber TaxID=1908690 RepID=A0A225DA74_9BACT|nr:hypothetical protein [Fimbriiglobus ruber]OWK38461.1 hypothetical protein FRUB_07581 [Fimbriiglobus ruber]
MIVEHLKTFVWLRWRLVVNQTRRGGSLNAAIASVLVAGVLVTTAVAFVGGVATGAALGGVSPAVLTYVWDGVVVAFLFAWSIGLVAELQRADSLSPDKFLHLPVSPAGVFLINYVSSLFDAVVMVFSAGMVGLTLGLALSRGPTLLALLLPVAALIFMVTAVTYQFQGWLATLMVNKRRRRTVVVVAVLAIALLGQLPVIVTNFFSRPGRAGGVARQHADLLARFNERTNELVKTSAGKLPPDEFSRRLDEIQQEYQDGLAAVEWEGKKPLEEAAAWGNVVFPPGWVPLAVGAAAEGHVAPALLGSLGLTAMGAVGLWRAYRTNLRIYTGQLSNRQPGRAPAAEAKAKGAAEVRPRLLEWKLPWVDEPVAAVALAGFRAMLRAPEAKMALMSPVIFGAIFGSMFVGGAPNVPPHWAPMLMVLAVATVQLSVYQLIGNQFGYDRGGFRAYVLSPAPRRSILLGKNLAAVPFAAGLGAVVIVALAVILWVRVDRVLAAVEQWAAMFLACCMVANVVSIYAPIPIVSGAFKAASVRLVPVLLHMVAFFALPAVFAPAIVPPIVEGILEETGLLHGWPVSLVLSTVVLTAVVFVYRRVIAWEGGLLADQEKKILEIVTSKEE